MQGFVILAALVCGLLGFAVWSLRPSVTMTATEAVHAPSVSESTPPPLADSSVTPTSTGDTDALVLEIERALVSVDDAARDRAYMQLLPMLIARDASAVARVVENTPSGPTREELLHHTARMWTANDADGAIEWAATLKDDRERLTAAADITSQLAQSNPASAIEVSDLFGIGRDNGVLEHLVQVWATDNLHEALDWIRQQPASAQRDQLLARILAVKADAELANTPESAMTRSDN